MAYRIVDTLVPGSANKFPVVDVVNVSIKDQYLDAYLDNLNGTIITLSAAVEDLRKRIVALENGTVAALDKTKINSLITQANSLNEENYTTDSWESLEVAYAAAIKARDEATTQGELDEAALALEQAIADLEKISETTVDKTALAIVISEVNKLNEANYSVPSWDALEDAKTTAETVYADSTVTQTRVDEAKNNLEDARDSLLDISELKAAIERAQGYNEADYTSDSWEVLETALVNAQSVLNSANADIEGETQISVNDAADNLYNACDSLVPKTESQIEFVIDASAYDQGENKEYSVAAGTTWRDWYDTDDAPDSYSIDGDNRIIPAGGWYLEDSSGNTIYASNVIAAGTYYWKADNSQEEPTGIVDTIITDEMPMYQVNESGELVEVSYKLLNFDTTTAAVAATESGFYQIKDTAGNVIESGYQHASNPNDSMYYVIVLPKEMDFNTNVSVQSWDALQNEWSSDRVVMSDDLAMIERAFTDAGLTLPQYDTERYTLWLDASLDTCSGIDYRFIINE